MRFSAPSGLAADSPGASCRKSQGDPYDGSPWAMQKTESKVHDDAGSGALRKVLTFSLGAEVYGVDILRLKEIRGWSPVTRLPHTPGYLLGVLNLRGVVIPVIDLRLRFGLSATEVTPITVIIVLSLQTAAGASECGIVVDSVRDVLDIDTQSIRPAPALSGSCGSEFIEGIATADEQMLILVDAQRLASNDSTSSSSSPAARAA
jgi:purine-binding chemotaxis protein CheW